MFSNKQKKDRECDLIDGEGKLRNCCKGRVDVRSKRGNKDDIERTIGNADISSWYVFVTYEGKKKKKCGYVCFAYRCKESIVKK